MKVKFCTQADQNVYEFLPGEFQTQHRSLPGQVHVATSVVYIVRDHYRHLLFKKYKPAQLSLQTVRNGPNL